MVKIQKGRKIRWGKYSEDTSCGKKKYTGKCPDRYNDREKKICSSKITVRRGKYMIKNMIRGRQKFKGNGRKKYQHQQNIAANYFYSAATNARMKKVLWWETCGREDKYGEGSIWRRSHVGRKTRNTTVGNIVKERKFVEGNTRRRNHVGRKTRNTMMRSILKGRQLRWGNYSEDKACRKQNEKKLIGK